jgi:hypothetical protein
MDTLPILDADASTEYTDLVLEPHLPAAEHTASKQAVKAHQPCGVLCGSAKRNGEFSGLLCWEATIISVRAGKVQVAFLDGSKGEFDAAFVITSPVPQLYAARDIFIPSDKAEDNHTDSDPPDSDSAGEADGSGDEKPTRATQKKPKPKVKRGGSALSSEQVRRVVEEVERSGSLDAVQPLRRQDMRLVALAFDVYLTSDTKAADLWQAIQTRHSSCPLMRPPLLPTPKKAFSFHATSMWTYYIYISDCETTFIFTLSFVDLPLICAPR